MKNEIFKTLAEKYRTEKTDELVNKFNSLPDDKKDAVKNNLLRHAENGNQDAASAWQGDWATYELMSVDKYESRQQNNAALPAIEL